MTTRFSCVGFALGVVTQNVTLAAFAHAPMIPLPTPDMDIPIYDGESYPYPDAPDEPLPPHLQPYALGNFAEQLSGASAQAGASLLDAAYEQANPQAHRAENPDLAELLDVIDAYLLNKDWGAAEQLATRFGGADAANLPVALRGQTELSLRRLSNRMTFLPGDEPPMQPGPWQTEANKHLFWAYAGYDYLELESESSAPGYKLRNTGGSIGGAYAVSKGVWVAGELSGYAGRFRSTGELTEAKGDIDSLFVSIGLRCERGNWQHHLLGTVGVADIEQKRSVYMPTGYVAKGDSTGLSFGLQYEGGYNICFYQDETRRADWQPFVSAAYLHSNVSAYTESGSDAALRVAPKNCNNAIFGAGLRLQCTTNEWSVNGCSAMEARVLAKATTGTRRGKARVSLPSIARSATVEGAEQKAFAVEMGVGFRIPVFSGSVFTDVSAEFANERQAANIELGYALDF